MIPASRNEACFMPLANLNHNPRQSPVCPSTVASQAGTSHFSFTAFFSHSLEVLTNSSLNFGPFIFGFMLRPWGCFDWAFLWMTVSLLTHLSLSLWEPSKLLPSKSASHGRGKRRPPPAAWHRGGSSITCCIHMAERNTSQKHCQHAHYPDSATTRPTTTDCLLLTDCAAQKQPPPKIPPKWSSCRHQDARPGLPVH